MFLKLERMKVISGVKYSVLKGMIVDHGFYDAYSIVFISSNLHYGGCDGCFILSSQFYARVG